MNVLFITSQAPYGNGEAFVIEELVALKAKVDNIYVCPAAPSKPQVLYHAKASAIAENVISAPVVNAEIILSALKFCVSNPKIIVYVIQILFDTKGFDSLAKNAAIIPKALWLCNVIKDKKINHIHAYWGAHTATMAMIVAKYSNIKWSFTAYRWDISVNNLLSRKVSSATFIRSADKQGILELIALSKPLEQDKAKFILIRSGVDVNHIRLSREDELIHIKNDPQKIFTFLMPAFFVEKKGHKYLVDAAKLLRDRGHLFQCILVGDGEKKQEIENLVMESHLENIFRFDGSLPLEELNRLYLRKEVDAVILPSIVTDDNQREGIPVSLIDALACGVPVISTNTGGITELISEDVGIIVEQRRSDLLADAMEYFMLNPGTMNSMSESAINKIEQEYSMEVFTIQFMSNISK
jgi:colanic acid/amylovoran biosynthesis glycosyltransferase